MPDSPITDKQLRQEYIKRIAFTLELMALQRIEFADYLDAGDFVSATFLMHDIMEGDDILGALCCKLAGRKAILHKTVDGFESTARAAFVAAHPELIEDAKQHAEAEQAARPKHAHAHEGEMPPGFAEALRTAFPDSDISVYKIPIQDTDFSV